MQAFGDQLDGPTRPRWRHWGPAEPSDSDLSADDACLRGHAGNLAKLRERTLAVLGTGAVGGVALQSAARHLVGTLIAVDPDRYGADSWRTQPALPTDAGRPKAWVQAERAHAIHSRGSVLAAVGFAQDVPLSVLRRADVLLVAGDNREVLVWAGQVAAGLGLPLIQGAVHGESWTAFVRGFDLADPEASCPSCMMSDAEYRQLGTRYGCDPATARLQGLEPTQTLPVVCGTAGQLAASEAIKRLLGVKARPLAGEEVAYCLLTHRVLRTELPRNPRCRGSHRRWRQADVTEPLTEVTLARLAATVGREDGLQVRSDTPWISFVMCAACGRKNEVRRFARLTEPVGRCGCGEVLLASPIGRRSVLPAGDLRACWQTPLAELGLGPGAAVGLSSGDDWTYFFAAGSPLSFEEDEKTHE